MSLLDDFAEFSELCIKCKNFDLMLTNTCKIGLTPVDKTRVECDKFEQAST
ncbi:MAG: hypothetical protein ACW981_01485 [Candidatus Hodarchaeales archaeon]